MLSLERRTTTIWAMLDAPATLAALAELDRDRAHVALETDHAVARARTLGLSWAQIGSEMCMSKQAAWDRWHHTDPAAAI